MKKLISVILSMAMVLCMTVTGFAAGETYSITINNSTAGHIYEVYQIFTGDVSNKTLSNVEWGSGVNQTGKDALGSAADKAKELEGGNAATAETFAKTLVDNKYLITEKIPTLEYNQNEKNYSLSGLTAGYYLVKDKEDKDNPIGKGDAYSAYIVQVVGNVSMAPKSSIPTVEKKVKDINDSTETELGGWQDSADHDINDAVEFQLTGTIAENYDKYKTYQFIFHDTLSDGLTFNEKSVRVYVGNQEIKSGYEVVTTDLKDDCTFEVKFTDLKQIQAVKSGSKITVEYNATLNSEAVIGSTGNPNDVYLEYSNNPNSAGTGKTEKDTVRVFTYKTIVNKVTKNDKNENVSLAGAAFKLEKWNKNENKWTLVKKFTAGEETTFEFRGLDDGNYKLTETATPDGYNTIDPIEFTITAEHEIDSADPQLKSLSGDATTGEITFTSSINEGSLITDVVNNTGAELPETGGIGTKIFYVVGAALVIGAGVLLITRKRMSTR